MLRLALVASLVLSGTPEPKPKARAATIADAWTALPETGSACGDDLGFDYGIEGGMRNFFCRALTVFSWKRFLSLAPVSPFVSGPHQHGKLDLKNEKTFGHYDPYFVRWAATALVPAASDASLREKTQRIYDRQVKNLARTYYVVWRVLQVDPQWTSRERATYQALIDKGEGGFSASTMDLYDGLLGDSESNWGGYDPNLVRPATTWWLRRTMDETASDWATGLERLLSTYDAAWLKAQQAKPAPKPPKRGEKPEYSE